MKTEEVKQYIPHYKGFVVESMLFNPLSGGNYTRVTVYKKFLCFRIKIIRKYAIMSDGKIIELKIN